jgi:hypothetical protein
MHLYLKTIAVIKVVGTLNIDLTTFKSQWSEWDLVPKGWMVWGHRDFLNHFVAMMSLRSLVLLFSSGITSSHMFLYMLFVAWSKVQSWCTDATYGSSMQGERHYSWCAIDCALGRQVVWHDHGPWSKSKRLTGRLRCFNYVLCSSAQDVP